MGELRNSILEMQKQVAAASKMGDALAAELDAVDTRVTAHYERLTAGCDTLWQYLDSMFTKNSRKMNDFINDKLSEHADSEVLTLIKGIDSAADDVAKALGEYATIKAKMPVEYQRVDKVAAAIRANIAKKRSKLLQSKKYKAKITGYEKALDELMQAIDKRRKSFSQLQSWSNTQAVNNLRVKPAMTLKQVGDLTAHSVKSQWEGMKKAVEQGTYLARGWRDNGDLKAAFEQMKQWAADADTMDAEVIALDPEAAKPIKDVKIFEGSRLVATAPKATYQGKRPMEVPAVTWARGVDSLSLLQKKITLKATSAAGGGEVITDMKINGIKGTTVKLT